MVVDRVTPEAIALGLFSCAAFGALSIAAQVFSAIRIAIVCVYVLLGVIGIPVAVARDEQATLLVIEGCAVLGTIAGVLGTPNPAS